MSRRGSKSRELQAALRDTTCLRSANTRRWLLSELLDNGVELDIEIEGSPGYAAYLVATACLEKPFALHALRDVVDFIDHGTAAANRVTEIVDELMPSAWFGTVTERWTYLRMIEPYIDPERLPRYYARATGRAPDHSLSDVDALVRAVERLLPADEGLSPLLILTETIAARVDGPDAAGIAEWSDKFVERGRHGERAALADFRSRPGGRDRHRPTSWPPALIVWLEPYGNRHDEYLLTGWFHDARTAVALSAEPGPARIQQIPEMFRGLLTQALIHMIAAGSDVMTLEFVLPRELLSHPVEDWEVDPDTPWRTLKAMFPVVVRDLRRQHDITYFPDWRRKWKRLVDKATFTWLQCSPAPFDSHEFYTRMRATDLVALGLAAPFHPDQPESPVSLALDAGLPIVVWLRMPCVRHWAGGGPAPGGPCAMIELKAQIERLLDGLSLRDLPDVVHRLRTDPDTRHLQPVLLFDDPDRRPVPDFGWSPPDPIGDDR